MTQEEKHQEMSKKEQTILDEAAEEYTQKMLESWRFDSTGCRPLREPFKAGAEWQKAQMLKDAMKATVTTNLADRPIIYLDQLHGFEYGDKVRIIILKEWEE